MDYLKKNIKEDDDAFTIAQVLLALEMGGGDQTLRDTLAASLVDMKQHDDTDNTIWWGYGRAGNNEYRGYNTRSTETTAYAIMALNLHGGYGSVVNGAVKYLLTHRAGGR